MVEFRKYRANTTRVTTSEEPYTIPDNFHALIALLVQDRYSIELHSLDTNNNHFANLYQ
jgi:hypothetical protein